MSVYKTVEFGKTIKVGGSGNLEVVHSTFFIEARVKLLAFESTWVFFGCIWAVETGVKAIADVV